MSPPPVIYNQDSFQAEVIDANDESVKDKTIA